MFPTTVRGRPGRRPATGGHHRPQRAPTWRRLATALVVVATAGAVFLLGDVSLAYAAPEPGGGEPNPLVAIVNNIRGWLFGILVAVATLFLTIGGLRLMWANGDPGEAEKGKAALKSAAIGYALALLAPVIVKIIGGWVT
jgi:hypothetical protein